MAVNQQGDAVGYAVRNPDVNKPKIHHIAQLYADSYNIASDLVHDLTRDVIGHTILIRIMQVVLHYILSRCFLCPAHVGK